MDLVIYKYPLETKEGTINVPRKARVIYCGVKGGRPNLWLECLVGEPTEEVETEPLNYQIIATGESFPPRYEHLGSFIHEDKFVWHVYRKPFE